jgi:hypothetical protein
LLYQLGAEGIVTAWHNAQSGFMQQHPQALNSVQLFRHNNLLYQSFKSSTKIKRFQNIIIRHTEAATDRPE